MISVAQSFRLLRALAVAPVFFLLTSICGGVAQLKADVTMPGIFGDHMVLQQDLRLPVWGRAEAGEKITVTFNGKSATTVAGPDGKWRVDLDKMPANTAPGVLTIAGKTTVEFKDVLVGDVWICSGQSNMVMGVNSRGLTRYHQDLQKRGEKAFEANYPGIRLFFVTKSGTAEPSDTLAEAPFDSPLQGKWQVCTPESVRKLGDFTDQNEGGFSAVGYFFAQRVHAFTSRPVGIIGTYMGATGIDAWSSLDALKQEPAMSEYVEKLSKPSEYYSMRWADYVARYNAWKKDVEQPHKEAMARWQDAAAAAKAAGQPEPPKPSMASPRPVNLNMVATPPASLFNGMVHPLIPYGIRGVVWYQGENNTGKPAMYRLALPNLIRDWRRHWEQGDFPFLVVQLPNIKKPLPEPYQKSDSWPGMREAQLSALTLPHTGVAVTIDIGDEDIHPRDKFNVGLRLAQLARSVAYGDTAIVGQSPAFATMTLDGTRIRLKFNNTGAGLKIGTPPWPLDRPTETGEQVKGFAIAGDDRRFVWAEARIVNGEIVVWSDQVPSPKAIRYAWAENPVCNLYNSEMLPAVPFRTDNW